jgi:pimeloyl-ACP methyl ester carboxylesterase
MSYADVNGLSLYYEEHGSGGVPLILIHGGFGAAELYGPIVPALAEQRRVIAVDLQGHGHTADIDRPLRPEDMADDIAALIAHVGVEEADLMGYSLGGLVALRTAIQHPGRVRRLVLISITFRRDGSYPEVVATMDQMGPEVADALRPSPLGELYARSAPRPDDWSVLVGKTTDMLKVDYDWTEETEAMTTPTMLVFADADSVRPEHIVEFYGLLGGGRRDASWDGSQRPVTRLAILPGTTHYDVSTSPALVTAVLPFLEASSVEPPAPHGA